MSEVIWRARSWHSMPRRKPLWDGIVSARSKRVTSENPSRRKQASLEGPVFLQCLDCIRRAARHVPATWWQYWRQCHLIPTNHQNKQRPHKSMYPADLGRGSPDFSIYLRCNFDKLSERQSICRGSRMNDHVDRRQYSQ